MSTLAARRAGPDHLPIRQPRSATLSPHAAEPEIRINQIPHCWGTDHEWGGMCFNGDGDCHGWWVARSGADPRTARPCANLHQHSEHLWLRRYDRPPLPYTMWSCPGRPRYAPEVPE